MTLRAELRNYKAGTHEEVEVKEAPMEHHKRGLSYTASGYGRKIPTTYMIRLNNRWQRVYCCIFSNVGSLYIASHKHLSVDVWHSDT